MDEYRGRKADFIIIDDLLDGATDYPENRASRLFRGDLEMQKNRLWRDMVEKIKGPSYRELDLYFLSYNLMLGEETMNEKKAQARRLLHKQLSDAHIHVKDTSTLDSVTCGTAREEPGYWIPVKLFVPQAELVSDREYERVAYETALTMDTGTLLDYVTNSLIDIYKNDHRRFEEDKTDLEEDDE